MALLLAALVLAMAGAAAMAVHRAVVRGWATEGACLLGDRAALAADATLAWCLEQGPELLEGAGVLEVPPGVVSGDGAGTGGRLRVRYLGEREGLRTWKLTAEGWVSDGRGTFLQRREAHVVAPAACPAGKGAALTLRAWRIVRE